MIDNNFLELAKVDCSEHVEKKGNFTYLSWVFAVNELAKRHPSASWEIKRFPLNDGGTVMMPYLKTELGYFVEASVTIDGVDRSQLHPVLDHRNKPIEKPTTFDINTSAQRALVKAIALHGLGLYIYAGEDLPTESDPLPTITDEQIKDIEKLIEEVGADKAAFLGWLKVGDLSEVTQKSYPNAINALEKKRG